MSPNITGVRGNEEGQVTNQSHAFGVSVFLQLIGLPREQELGKANLLDLRCQLIPRIREGLRPPLNQLRWPLQIVRIVILDFQRLKERVVFQPSLPAENGSRHKQTADLCAPQLRILPTPFRLVAVWTR